MPVVAVVHPAGAGDWMPDDVIEAFEARKTRGVVEMRINGIWMACIGCGNNGTPTGGGAHTAEHVFLQLYIKDSTRAEMYGRGMVGKGMGKATWRTHFTAAEKSRIDDRRQRTQAFEKVAIVKSIITKRP